MSHIVRGWMESGIGDTSSHAVQRADSVRTEWMGETAGESQDCKGEDANDKSAKRFWKGTHRRTR